MIRTPIVRLLLLASASVLGPTAGRAEQARPDSTAVITLPEARARAWQVGLVRPDRLQHATASLTIGFAVGLLAHRPGAAAAAGFGFGLLKEIYDIRRTGFDAMDLTADAIGVGMASGATAAIEN